jgi:cytochrome o ubiquinol oxidase operon protein cyoD
MTSSSHSHASAQSAHDEAVHGGGLKDYLVGFALAVVLTVIPFVLVMSGFFPAGVNAGIAAIFALVQIVVHLRFFLHMGNSPSQRGNLLVFLATVLCIGIALVGTLWVMYNMNANMMH